VSATISLNAARRWWVATGILILIGAGCLVAGLRGHPTTLNLPSTSDRATASDPNTTGQNPTSVVERSAPVLLSIPVIGISIAVSQLGLNPDGTVQVPTNADVPGWFHLGPSPGQVGSAVILGHVDTHRGPAVFFNLRSLKTGDQVNVTLADGVVTHFLVSAVVMYSKSSFPGQEVYGSHGKSQVQLVTCGGEFDSQTGHYLSNIVVYTSLEGVSGPATSRSPRV